MDTFKEGFDLLDKLFGNGKDNIISLATIALQNGEGNLIRPVVRGVDALYENGSFYVSTNSKSNKMKQIERNPEVSVCSAKEMFTASGTGKNLGWVLDPKNSEIRNKLRTAFSAWYDMANNENDENCCILQIKLVKGTLNINHWEKLYHMDFINKVEMKDGGVY